MDLYSLERAIGARAEPAYRARQVWRWAARGAAGYGEMTDLPEALRAGLARDVPFSTLTLETEATSRDGTVKALFRTGDGHPVEAVLMRYFELRRRKVFVEYVMLAGVNDRVEQARGAGRPARSGRLQGQPDPVRPHWRLRGLVAEGDRCLRGRPRAGGCPGDDPARARPRHRRRLRPARRACLGARAY
jgi:hypothetical protein